jgi:hypothetical protein
MKITMLWPRTKTSAVIDQYHDSVINYALLEQLLTKQQIIIEFKYSMPNLDL